MTSIHSPQREPSLQAHIRKTGDGSGGGFSTPELLMAVLILSIGLASAWGFMSSLLRLNAYSSGVTTATALAEDKIEDLIRSDYTTISYGADSVAQYSRQWKVDEDTTLRTKTIVINVSWGNVAAGTHSLTLKTMLAE